MTDERNATKARKKRLIKRLRKKLRLQIINESTFEERFALNLTPLNIISYVTATFLGFGVMMVCLIMFTPLKNYIPGYADPTLKANLVETAMRLDSVEMVLSQRSNYLENIYLVLRDSLPNEDAESTQLTNVIQNVTFSKSEADSLMRKKIEEDEKYNLAFQGNNSVLSQLTYYFPPVRGLITSKFNPAEKHYGIDVVAPEKESIKAVLDGTVIQSSWTSDAGYVIQVQHQGEIVSIYKHNSVLLKSIGDRVSAGEPIAVIGNTGELTSGPHLHFELWKNGEAVNPEKYIVFK